MTGQNPRPNPYVGPRAYQTGEALYGRDREIQEVLDLLIAERIILLYSPSGAGKSSLVQAGLIPRLREEGFHMLPVVRVNLELPPDVSKVEVNRYTFSILLSLEEALPKDQRLSIDQLTSITLESYLKHFSDITISQPTIPSASSEPALNVVKWQVPSAALRQTQPESTIQPLQPSNDVLIFDQFEEILTVNPADRINKLTFFTQLGTALRDRSRWALFVMREDFVPALDPYLRSIPTRLANTYRLDLLGADAACQAIQNPTRKIEVDFTDDAARKLVDDLRQVRIQRPDGSLEEQLGLYVEPVQLQVVCYRLWENLTPDDTQIDEEDLTAIGNVDAALANYYADQVQVVARETGVRERIIREWINHQLITEQGLRGQVLMGQEKSEGLDNHVIRLLEDAHLVRAEKRGGATWFELSHDRLIQPVRENNAAWLQANLSLLQRQAALWEEQDRNETQLLREKALAEAETWAAAYPEEMTSVEQEFLEACQKKRNQEAETLAREKQAIQLQEQMKVASKLRQRALYLSVALVAALIMTVAAIFLGSQASQNAAAAQRQRSTAQAANTQEVAQRSLAEIASTQAVAQKAIAVAQQGTAEAASTQANIERFIAQANESAAQANERAAQTAEAQARAQKVTVESASTQVAAQAATAQAASTQAVAERNLAATAQAEAEKQRDEAEKQSKIALSRGLADTALSFLGKDSTMALLLSIEAYRSSNTLQALNAVLTALQSNLTKRVQQFGRPIPLQDGYIYSIAFSPDGQLLAWGCSNGVLALWDVQEQKLVWSQAAHDGNPVYAVAFSPDQRFLVSGSRNNLIVLWDVKSGQPKQEIKTSHGYVLSLNFSPDGKMLASGGLDDRVAIWDTTTYTLLRTLKPHGGSAVWSVAWSPNGVYLAFAGDDRTVRVWDTADWTEILTLQGHEGRIYSLAWSPDSKWLASGGKDEVGEKDKLTLLWDMSNGKYTVLKGHTDDVTSVAFSADGKTLASGSLDKSIILWDVKSQQPFDQLFDHTQWVICLTFSPQASNLLASGGLDKKVFLYELKIRQLLGTDLLSAPGPVQGIYFTSKDTLSVISNRKGDVSLTSIQVLTSTQREVHSLGSSIAHTAVSVDGAYLAFEREGGTIQITEASTGNEVAKISNFPGNLTSMAFSLDDEILAVGVCMEFDPELEYCTQPLIALWEVASGEQMSQLPDSSIYTAQTQLLPLHLDSILSLAFSPDGLTLASGSADRTIILWDVARGLPIGDPLRGHTGSVTSLAYKPDGTTLASGSEDGKLILWDIVSRRPIGEPFTGINGTATSLVFSPDGEGMVSGSDASQVMWWDVSIASWIDRACQIAGRALSLAEWEQYIPGEPYKPTCQEQSATK